jgi:hypothetical protein
MRAPLEKRENKAALPICIPEAHMGVLPGARSILHINEKAGRFGGTEEYIASLTKLLSPLGIDSHLIYDHLHGEIPSLIRSRRRIEGLGDRDARRDVSRRVLQTVSRINPDVVYVHNIFDGRVIEALDTPERKYDLTPENWSRFYVSF